MRFPRFHFGTAIALGLSMLCMSSVPVFADGISAPTLSASVNGSTVGLSWNKPIGTASFVIRRSTVSSPTTTASGTLVASPDGDTTSYSDTSLANGTYYYSIFAIDAFDNSSSAGTADPVTISVTRGGNRVARLARQRMLLNPIWPDTEPPSLSEVGIFQSSPATMVVPVPAAPKPSAPVPDAIPRRVRTQIKRAEALSDFPEQTHTQRTTPSQRTAFEQRVCERVWQRFSDDALDRVNMRLQNRLGFTCIQ